MQERTVNANQGYLRNTMLSNTGREHKYEQTHIKIHELIGISKKVGFIPYQRLV